MSSIPPNTFRNKAASIILALSLLFVALAPFPQRAIGDSLPSQKDFDSHSTEASPLNFFRLETIPVEGGGEIITIFGNLRGLERKGDAETDDVPLVSVLRDTLGDVDSENDRLRYVWTHTYAKPTKLQRLASFVPFLYMKVGGKKKVSPDSPPPAIIDLSGTESDVWQRFMWLALQNVLFNPYGVAVKSSTNAFDRNRRGHRQAHIIRALAILALYQHETGAKQVFSATELREIQARLMLTDKIFGGIVDDAYLERYYQNQSFTWRDTRGHNWELLRQHAEAEGLYFEPLTLPNGEATHALLWVARGDLSSNRTRKFNGRFLNFSNPWRDKRLLNWKGYSETRHFDANSRAVASDAEGARQVELIPLALYGLEHPKIPILLVDFRDGGNAKRREASRRLIEDIARNVLALSKFGDIHYFLGRTVLDFVTSRRGIDFNQPTRLRAYSQLKLLLSLSATLDPELRDEINERVSRVSTNPLEDDLKAEARLAREQYEALVRYAKRPKGLAARIDRDRRAELVPLEHGRTARTLFRIANLLSFGLYKHREDEKDGELRERIDAERRLAFHRRFLREVSKSSPVVEVVWNIEDVQRSLHFIGQNGTKADANTARAVARIFFHTEDEETKRLSLNCLYRINNATAKNELLRIYKSPDVAQDFRQLSADYLRRAMREEQRINPADAKAVVSVIGQ